MLTNVFGFEIEYESWNKQNSLPIYISGNYKFYMAFICETRCIIIKPAGKTDTLPALKKHIEKEKITKNMILAGESALSEYTMLNSGRIITYAVNEKDFDKSLLIDELIDPLKQVQLELWKYDSNFFSDGEVADKLSVALSFMEDKDERIEEAVDELIERELRK